MKFDIIAFFLNSFVLIFLTLTLGSLFGKIKFWKFNFGIAGSLFVGLIFGYYLTKYSVVLLDKIDSNSKLIPRINAIIKGNVVDGPVMKLSLLIFIVATGLLAAKDIKYTLKKFGKQFVIIAIIVPLAGAVSSYGLAKVFSSVSPFEITGTYTGALTSSAGLAAAIESSEAEANNMIDNFSNLPLSSKNKILNIINDSKYKYAKLRNESVPELLTVQNTKFLTQEEGELFINAAKAGVGAGHSIGYPYGVLFLLLCINFIPLIFGIDVEEEKRKYFLEKEKDMKKNSEDNVVEIKEVPMDFAAFSVAAFLGYVIGNIKIYLGPLGYFSLGSIGGAIIVSLLLGYIGKVGPFNFRMNSLILGKMRTYFLALFLAGTGLNFGFKAVQAVVGNGLSISIVSILVTLIAILVGFVLGHYVFHINWTVLSGAITGGMTSAPGLGAAIDAIGCDEPAASYGAPNL